MMVDRVNREIVVVLGWGRAILLQVAHPLVAAGVADHSDYGEGLWRYLARTRQTVGAMQRLTFGSDDEVRATAGRINAIHRRVHGTVSDGTPAFPRGTAYRATDPELLRWVHVTLVESQLLAYETFVQSLSGRERDDYCAEASSMAPLLGLPVGAFPDSWADVRACLKGYETSGTIEVTETARRLATRLLHPPGSLLTGLPMAGGRVVTVGLLPPSLRRAYGFSWTSADAWRFRSVVRLVRAGRRILPASLREWPAARAHDARPPRRCPVQWPGSLR